MALTLAEAAKQHLAGDVPVTIDFMATRKKQGGRWVYHFDPSVAQLIANVDAPPMDVEQEDNRIVVGSRCRDFAAYLDATPHWAIPSVMLWTPHGTVQFVEIPELSRGGMQVGILKIDWNMRYLIRILDGQHRIGGFHIWMRLKQEAFRKAEEHLAAVINSGDQLMIDEAKARRVKTKEAMNNATLNFVGADLLEVDSVKEAKQAFAHIANNAKGMTKSVTTAFDSSKVVNRVTQKLVLEMPHPVLENRVEWHKDKFGGANPHLLSAKNVADIVRATYVGSVGRISKAHELPGVADSPMYTTAKHFFTALQEAFPDVMGDPVELRKNSLLGSPTMLRALAGAWHILTTDRDAKGKSVNPRMSRDEVTAFFTRLAPHMQAPVTSGNPWLTTGNFREISDGDPGLMAPESKQQDLKALPERIANWALGVIEWPFPADDADKVA